MAKHYDAIVGGGSVAGLAFAAEAARRGIAVLVAEEHEKIGEPEKCDGLVSLGGLRRYGFTPERDVVQNRIALGVVHSPSGNDLALDAEALDVVVLDRSAYDRQIAERALSWGAELRTDTRVSEVRESRDGVAVRAGGELLEARYYVNATGLSTAHQDGVLSAAKYEIEAEWIRQSAVEVFFDAEKYPGFFAWVIPYGARTAKVGVAGRGINAFEALDSFLSARPHRRLRRVVAPIYVGGPVRKFVTGRTVRVGESAGQVKPTTAGGIMTSVAGAVMAARWLSDSIQSADPAKLANYQTDWESHFLKEMRSMLRVRRVFEKLSNSDINSIVSVVSSPRFLSKLSQSDFDFHATALLGVLGISGLLKVARAVASAETRSLFSGV